jgi:hypothetical protein
MNKKDSANIPWHKYLGTVLEEWLTDVKITVQTDFVIGSEPPRGDILLLRNQHSRWNKKQRERLPDGICDSNASHILLEFKYSESINRDAFLQTLGYDNQYRKVQRLKEHQLQSFILSSKTTQHQLLQDYGYELTDQAGIYESDNILLRSIPLISINELPDTLGNIPLKFFASKQSERRKSFKAFKEGELKTISPKLEWLLHGLRKIFTLKGEQMPEAEELSVEKVVGMGKEWVDQVVSTLPLKELLKHHKPEEIKDYLESLDEDKKEDQS